MDKTLPRLAQASDLPQLLALAERANHKTTALQGIQNLRESDFDLFVLQSDRDITGFLLLKRRLVRTITGDCESVIEDHFAVDATHHRSLVESAVTAARSYGSQFITLEIDAQLSQERERFELLDFHLESHRISVATTHWPPPEESPYTVRSPEVGDDFLIAILNSTMLEHTLCAGRDYDLSELTFRSMNSTLHQVNSQDPNSITLVLAQDSQLVGHLLLQIVDQSGYIYDLAVAREHWGGRATRQLMRAGSSLLFQRNIPLMVGDVSATNLRALKFAQRFLGFSVDCVRYGRRL